jgi:hypothetical protein
MLAKHYNSTVSEKNSLVRKYIPKIDRFGGDLLQGYLEDPAGWGRPIRSGFVRHINVELFATKDRDQLVVPTRTT